ncbi:MAG: hypothetical protein HYS33_03705 [Acidobacteria bacterium]|nr:hypothetical protein [Acidobacteriota bacterium]
MNERIDPLIHRVIEPLKKFVRGPYALLAAVGLAAVMGGLALREHDARLRRGFELQQLKVETEGRVKELEGRAAEAVHAANQRNALIIRELEAGRKKLAAEGERLRERLGVLERDERVRVERVATLPSNELAERVATRLDAGALEARGSGLGTRGWSKTGARLPPASSTPVSARPGKEDPSAQPPALGATAGTPPLQPTLTLDADALRKVETAFVELESCREQRAVKDEQVANCHEQLAASGAIAARLDDSVRQLNQALRLKDEILARREEWQRAELKAARGSRWERFRKAVTYVAVGVVIGAAAR